MRIMHIYNQRVIRTLRHRGLRKFYDTSSKAGIQANHAARLRMQLTALDTAHEIGDMDLPGVSFTSPDRSDEKSLGNHC